MFYESGISPEKAVMMAGVTVQQSGQSGEKIGTFYQTMLSRLRSDDTVKELESMGIKVYNKDALGNIIKRSGDEILEHVASIYYDIPDDMKHRLAKAMYGERHISKGIGALTDMSGSQEFSLLMDTIKAYEAFKPEDLEKIMSGNMNARATVQARAGVSVNTALTSLLEELSPTIVRASTSRL